MDYDKGLALVARIKPKQCNVELAGRLFSKDAVAKVDRATADLAAKDKRFDVFWEPGYEPKPKAQPKTEAATPVGKPDYMAMLANLDKKTVKAAASAIKKMTDKEFLSVVAEQASKKGTRTAAAERLAGL